MLSFSALWCLPSPSRILTWNVWFKQVYQEERAVALLKIAEELNPHILALQEITPAFLEILLQNQWIRKTYRCSDGPLGERIRKSLVSLKSQGLTITPYGVLLLCSLEVNDCFSLICSFLFLSFRLVSFPFVPFDSLPFLSFPLLFLTTTAASSSCVRDCDYALQHGSETRHCTLQGDNFW